MQKQEMVKSKWELKYDLNLIVEEKFRTAKSIIKNVKIFCKGREEVLKIFDDCSTIVSNAKFNAKNVKKTQNTNS